MAFHGFRRYSYSLASISQNAPSCPGVYGIMNASEWIFIGGGDDVRAELLKHWATPGTRLLSRKPTGFIFELCAAGECAARSARLIRELRPSCNLEGGRPATMKW